MTPVNGWIWIVWFLGGIVAGVLNVLAGGGSFLTLPLLILGGLSPTTANGTNRVGILLQNVGAVAGFRSHGVEIPEALRWMWLPALAGAPFGVWAALEIDEQLFERGLALVMVALGVWTFADRSAGDRAPWKTRPWVRALGFFAAGVYGGFVQAGVGFLLLTFAAWAGADLVRGNAFKVRCVLAFTVLALAGFATAGAVDWAAGLVLGSGTWLGGRIGVRWSVYRGHAWLRTVVLTALIGFAVLLWFR